MANEKMFSKDIVDSDRFLDMPPTAQNLYFHLGMEADDNGIITNMNKCLRAYRSTEGDLLLLKTLNLVRTLEKGLKVALSFAEWRNNRV